MNGVMAYCAAINCKSKVGESPDKTFHRFPTWNPAAYKEWIKNLGRSKSWKPTSSSVICSDHFEENCFDTIGDVKHIRADAVPTLFFIDDKPQTKCRKIVENPQIISVISLDNIFKTSENTEPSASDPLKVFHQKIDSICKQRKEAEKKKIIFQMLLSFKRFAINQQKIKIVLNRSRLLRRKMMQSAMMMILLSQQQVPINS